MNQKTFLLALISMTTFIYSCKKDKGLEPSKNIPPESYPNYSQLKVGNYWIYQQYEIETNGHATSKNIFDSCYVEKDTVINNKTYFKLIMPRVYENQRENFFQRDSSHYIVDSNGKIVFSSQDFTTIFEKSYYLNFNNKDTICQISRKMEDRNMAITTPSGTHITLNAKETYLMYPAFANAGNSRSINKRYAENLGIVVETLPFYFSDPNYVERRLVRYHIN